MQYSFLGFSVSKMMKLDLDVKDIIILRYFVDFKDTGRMNTEVIDGENYYWVNYKSMEDNMPHLALGKRAIMVRMLKLRDAGILKHYTKKEGGTFSFFALGDKYNELINKEFEKEDKGNKTNNKGNECNNKGNECNNKGNNKANISNTNNKSTSINRQALSKEIIESKEELIEEDTCLENKTYKNYKKNHDIDGVTKNVQGRDNYKEPLLNYDYGVFENDERESAKMSKGCASECRTKTLLLNNSSTEETNIKKYIKKEACEIIEYLNSKLNTQYKANSKNTIRLINSRLEDGFSVIDFKTVIDKKFKAWFGTEFEQYLTPFTLFGSKFEQYLNQKVVSNAVKSKNNRERSKLRFDNFTGRNYDYKELERQLLGW